MPEIMLHIGAHRTGTTSFQQMLRANMAIFSTSGVQVVIPPECRQAPLTSLKVEKSRAIISEENILGTMENNIARCSLYPDAFRQVSRYQNLIPHATSIFLSIRNTAEWWTSAILFCARSGTSLPSEPEIERIAKNTRSWIDVVDDIRRAAPNARLIVREFGWKTDNPKQQLRVAARWNDLAELKSNRQRNNARPSTEALIAALASRGDIDSLSRIDPESGFSPFSPQQNEDLRTRYQADLAELRLRTDITFLEDDAMVSSRAVSGDVTHMDNRICILHIGKTGGTYLKSILNNTSRAGEDIFIGKHSDTLASTGERFGRDRHLCFFFRDPVERFVSGFLSRMRQGRPRYNFPWTAAEATAYSFFASPNDLAEALDGRDERLKSAAHFAFKSILHLQLGYKHYLTSPEVLLQEHARRRIVVCCETDRIDSNLELILERLQLTGQMISSGDRNARPEEEPVLLSDTGKAALRRFWQDEFGIYDACRKIAADLGFSDT